MVLLFTIIATFIFFILSNYQTLNFSIFGIILIIIGISFPFLNDKLSWFGNLFGDIKYESKSLKIYFPFISMLIISLLLSLLINILLKIFK